VISHVISRFAATTLAPEPVPIDRCDWPTRLPNWQYAVPMRFAGQVAVVTGGALGIGGGISRRLAAAGAHVVLADAAEVIRDDITVAGGRCTVVVGDIRDRDVVAEVTKTALAVEDSRIDILVNNVGDFRPRGQRFPAQHRGPAADALRTEPAAVKLSHDHSIARLPGWRSQASGQGWGTLRRHPRSPHQYRTRRGARACRQASQRTCPVRG
jgi:hypothetical protein